MLSQHPSGILTEQTKLNGPFDSDEQLYISCFIGKCCPNALTVSTDTNFQNLKIQPYDDTEKLHSFLRGTWFKETPVAGQFSALWY